MKLTIFGASGSLGRIILQKAIEQGFQVTAFTRNAQKFSTLKHDNLQVLEGDVQQLSDVVRAVRGSDAVICALGDGAKGLVRATGTAHIIQAMRQQGCRRLVCQTTLGMGETWNNLNFFWKKIMFGWLLKKAFEDHRLQEEYIRKSELDYTIVRPSAFSKGPATQTYKIDFSPRVKQLKLKIAREDVAEFMLKQLFSHQYLHRAVSISH